MPKVPVFSIDGKLKLTDSFSSVFTATFRQYNNSIVSLLPCKCGKWSRAFNVRDGST